MKGRPMQNTWVQYWRGEDQQLNSHLLGPLSFPEQSSRLLCHHSENSRRLWLFPGSVRGFSRKTLGKPRENSRKLFPESRNATNSGISGTGKGKPAGNLFLSTLPGPRPHLPCGVFSEMDSSSLLEFFWIWVNHGHHQKREWPGFMAGPKLVCHAKRVPILMNGEATHPQNTHPNNNLLKPFQNNLYKLSRFSFLE